MLVEQQQQDDILKITSQLLERMTLTHSLLNSSKFDAKQIPKINIIDYLERMNHYLTPSNEEIIVTLMLIERFIITTKIQITLQNVHRIILTSLRIATKEFNDSTLNNQLFAKIGGVSNEELNSLEIEFLVLINFNIQISAADYFEKQQQIFSVL
eukprot:TRINITY_DN10729_c0_g1_i3.p1 TRINITY_DN10729_c0_g1~~TRINITY_DN10729_c0_g1_i3.p1  ORF type:complete len:155 (-),score=20.63 TRINITY_DN10729_c0_g1_i3:26-490(-)